MADWIIQIFEVTEARSQEFIVGLLSGISDITVEPATSGSSRFVVTECGDSCAASSIARIVRSIDLKARVVHVATGQGDTGRPMPAWPEAV